MATNAVLTERVTERGASASSAGLASGAAILAGVVGFGYAVAFVVLRDATWSALFLLLGGLLALPALVALHERLRGTDAPLALWGLVLGLGGALGAAVHGGYDLANALNPPPAIPDLPNPIDPRGLLSFGVAGLGLLIFARLMARDGTFPRGLVALGHLLATLLILLYLGRLIILDATSPLILVPALASGFIANPAWYIWLGLTLRRGA